MTHIYLETVIKAPIEKVFNLSLDIDFHQESASQTQEKAIHGVTSGKIGLGETVTWRGKHFGIWLTHTSLISAYESPTFFVDEMIKGNFTQFRHEHRFCEIASPAGSSDTETLMIDKLMYQLPYGILGTLINRIYLKKYLTNFLKIRNSSIREELEGK